MTSIASPIIQSDMTLEQKLAAIDAAMQQANGNVEKETQLINAIVDPQDALNCEGCQ